MTSTPPPTSDIHLVDLESPPSSPSLSRTKSFASLPKFTFTQESLIPEPLTRKASSISYNSDKSVSPSQSQEGMKEKTNKHGEEGNQDEENDVGQDTIISPTALLSPSSSPMKRDGSGSNSSSGTATSKGSLSAAATPFMFVKKPRQLSIVRKGTPPSFNFDDDHQTAIRDTPTSSIRSHIPYSASSKHGHTQTLPIYPYQTASPSYGDWNLHLNPYDQTITIQENKQGDVTSPRRSKATRIVSPLQDSSKAKKSRIDYSSSNDPPPSSFTPAPTKERKDTTTLRERRGKAEILSLYSQSQTKEAKAPTAHPTSNKQDGQSVQAKFNSNSYPDPPSVFDSYSFSFSFPPSSSSSTPAGNIPSPIHTSSALLAKATSTPLPTTPTTASSVSMDGVPNAQEVSSPLPKEVPLRHASTMRFESSLPTTPTDPSSRPRSSQAITVSVVEKRTEADSDILQPNELTPTAELDRMEEILQEIEEYGQIKLDRKEAEGLYRGRMEEVMARIKNAAMYHICLDPSKTKGSPPQGQGKERTLLEELYRSKFLDFQAQNLTLKREIHECQNANTTLKEENEILKKSERSKQEELDEAYKQFGHYKAEADVVKSKIQELLIQQHQLELDKLHSDKKGAKVVKMYHKAVKEKDIWEEAANELQQRLDTLKISRAVTETEKPDRDKELPFVAVLLEGHARMFDHKLIQKGEAGGRELANRLDDAVNVVWKSQNREWSSYMIVVHLFVDVVTVTKQLRTVGTTRDHAQFRSFLDGLTAHSELSIAQDCPDSEQAYDKMTEYIKLYAHTPNCKIILMGMPEAGKYLRFLELLNTRRMRDILHGIQSTKEAEDPLRVLGAGRLVEVPGFFPMEEVEWTRLYQQSKNSSVVSAASSIASSRAPSVASRASSAMSNYTIRAQSSHRERTEPSCQISSSSTIKSPQLADPTPIPPWNRPTQSVKQAPPATSDFISVIDRRYNLSPPSSYRNGKSTIRSVTSPTPGRKTTSKNKLVVPINPETDNIGGSPPSSDEDEPSVQLPHSAVKHVQRPTTIVQDASDEDDDDTGLPEGFKIRSATNPTRKLSNRIGPPYPTAPPPWDRKASTQSPAQAPRSYKDIIGKHMTRDERSASISSFSYGSVNSIPLGSRITRSSSISTEPEDRMFSSGPQDMGGHRARRKAEDYTVCGLRSMFLQKSIS
ncbi:hypothetical protein I203_101979 [Kwoniella mangroviensis CBS 8507]|uniref:uncharacterized protein n=1 Tax=Kwoniella mangroviensis CBS 8507 TaxID=1296122 RepID=UPI00080D7F26|nr:uncharacterized protein I203_03173 [Kwoniella mangroviensis CBS 8507]OCF67478.1 hypothetical protein I203_03173 [Kwoniella mangroviensis CBS 8507]